MIKINIQALFYLWRKENTLEKFKSLFNKIWNLHAAKNLSDDLTLLFIDLHLIHDVTSPQAFVSLKERGLSVLHKERTLATADHNVPTKNQHLEIQEEQSRNQVRQLKDNCAEFGIQYLGLNDDKNGIVHVIAPEMGLILPGMTIVCGDSHTSTLGAFGTIAFGIGTSEIEMVLGTQTLIQRMPKLMNIIINGELSEAVGAKDIALFIINKIGTSGATGYFIEYSGTTIEALSMEGRMTLCNMSIEMGARGGLIAPDKITYDYLEDKLGFLENAVSENIRAIWKDLCTDDGFVFDMVHSFNAEVIEPMITYGTNPGMSVAIGKKIPSEKEFGTGQINHFRKALSYMGFVPETDMSTIKVDYVFIGSCTNSRIEDLRVVAQYIEGRKKTDHTTVWVVPGSKSVEKQAIAEGLDVIFRNAGFEFRGPGCSACLGMNEDKIPSGKICISTSNRNFEGRQGIGARTILASPLTAAAAAIHGKITDPRN